jgi:phospholipid/cholesterol/gamma-HCH transport system substrate-binding protein
MNKEFKVGILVIIAGTVLYMGFSFLKGKDFFSTSNKYKVMYADVDGLSISNPVVMNGLNIGRVEDIEILHKKNDSLLVTFSTKTDLTLNNLSNAELISNGLLGGMALKLNIDSGKTIFPPGSMIKASATESFMSRIAGTQGKIDDITGLVKKYIEGENEKNINNSISNLNKAMISMAAATENLNLILNNNKNNINLTTNNMAAISQEINKNLKNLEPILKNVKGFSDSINSLKLNETVSSANQSLVAINKLMADINGGQGSLGKLTKTDEMHTNLNTTIKDIDYLVTDMQANPKKYIQFSVIGSNTPKDEKGIIKSFEKRQTSNLMTLELKREAPLYLTVKLFKTDRSAIEIKPQGLGTKTISFNIPAEFAVGWYLGKLDWEISTEAFQFELAK